MDTPARETIIALRARRTAFQIVSAFLASRRGGARAVTCADCGRRFVPADANDAAAPRCGACALPRAHPYDPTHANWLTSPTPAPHPFKRVHLPDFLMTKKS